MPETTRSPAQPAAVFGLTILIVALSFALPYTLVPTAERTSVSKYLSPETANVYACAAWAGGRTFFSLFGVKAMLSLESATSIEAIVFGPTSQGSR